MSEIRVLGCSGGIGGGRATTSFLVSGCILIDAGSGVMSLTLDQLASIDHVFLTHAHLDHVLALPLLVDSTGEMRTKPLIVHALPDVVAVIKEHIFNNKVWPDFASIPSKTNPYLVFKEIKEFSPIFVNECVLTAVPARHIVPACGWEVNYKGSKWIFSGDTCGHQDFWGYVANYTNVDSIIIEVSFPDGQTDIADLAGHYHPRLFSKDLNRSMVRAEIWVTHLKPGDEDKIKSELQSLVGSRVKYLENGQVFVLGEKCVSGNKK